jgi:hypothetical protein
LVSITKSFTSFNFIFNHRIKIRFSVFLTYLIPFKDANPPINTVYNHVETKKQIEKEFAKFSGLIIVQQLLPINFDLFVNLFVNKTEKDDS